MVLTYRKRTAHDPYPDAMTKGLVLLKIQRILFKVSTSSEVEQDHEICEADVRTISNIYTMINGSALRSTVSHYVSATVLHIPKRLHRVLAVNET